MGVTKTTIKEGSGATPQVGQSVTIEYTGWLKDTSKPDSKGNKYALPPPPLRTAPVHRRLVVAMTFDSSVGRGDFETTIGVGQVIKGWDEGVTQMKVGEKATLTISSDYAYGSRGFPGHIPPNSDLIFDVELKKIN
ncbi:FK506-binding protein 1B [Apiospora rasikravindrae]|uniref:peptidylprolyl isomerase n=1 Tax=Apiospora rasikravindrae TaxID=990691 RepID=A0ABR1TX78_9PEZI